MKVEKLSSVLHHFDLNPQDYVINPIEKGHINDSYSLIAQNKEGRSYFLQKINHQIFPEVDKLMENISLVTKTIHEVPGGKIECPVFLESNDRSYFEYQGQFFRISNFLKDYYSIESFDEDSIYRSGMSFGTFVKALSHVDPKKMHLTIPEFHNVFYRKGQLEKVLKEASFKSSEIDKLISIISEMFSDVSIIQKQIQHQFLPIRICHNDTKMDNIMFHKNRDDLCAVVDLDTVMPNSILFDYGDAIRSIISYSEEDAHIKNHDLNFANLRAFHFGYLDSLHQLISPLERSLMPISIVLLPFIMGIRFLSDHLNGNQYFKVQRDNQNLDRAINQLYLAKQLWKCKEELKI